jgi:RNA polymerase sigma-B factor
MDASQLELLLRRYHSDGDRSAREQAIVAALPYVRRLAKRFGGRGVPLEDLVQIGMLGAIKAVDRFDLDRGVAFSTYLTPLVFGEIKRHFRDRGWAVRVTRSLQELTLRLPEASDRLRRELGRPATISELAEALNVEHELVIEALEAAHAYNAQSLNTSARIDGDGEELIELLGATDPGYERGELRAQLKQAIAQLDAREQHVILLRFASGQTQSQVATQIGCSQMHISRIERRALATLRAAIDPPATLAA